jgi:hypothetical protein
MLRSGMNPIQLSIIAGASPEVVAGSYEHLTEDDAQEAMMKALTASNRRRRDKLVRRADGHAAPYRGKYHRAKTSGGLLSTTGRGDATIEHTFVFGRLPR